MSKDRTEYLGYGQTAMNENGKEIRHVIKETKTTFTLKIPAFTDRGKIFIGWTELELPKLSKESLEAFKAKMVLSDLYDRNRQKITDVRNDLARTYELKALIKKVKAGKATPAEVVRVFSGLAKTDQKLSDAAEELLKQMK